MYTGCVKVLNKSVPPASIASVAWFGIVLPQSPRVLRTHLHDILEDACNDIASTARLVLYQALEHWQQLDAHICWCEQRINDHYKDDEQVQRAAAIKGLGPLSASTVVVTVSDFKQFKNASQFWQAALGVCATKPLEDGRRGKPWLHEKALPLLAGLGVVAAFEMAYLRRNGRGTSGGIGHR